MKTQTYQEKYKEIQELFLVEEPEGYSKEELEKVKQEVGPLPLALEVFYLTYGKTEELTHLQDELILPNRYEDLMYEEDWNLAADSVSDFLVAMYGYQASLCLEYSPEEFYWIEEEEKEIIEENFPKRKEYIANWIEFSIHLYGDDNGGRITLMEQEEDGIQMNYAANSEDVYEKMQEILQNIGEEM